MTAVESSLLSLGGSGGSFDATAAGRVQPSDEAGSSEVDAQSGTDSAGCAGGLQAGAGPTVSPTPPATLREFEHALRGLGFTKRQAESIARHGWARGLPAAEPEPAAIASGNPQLQGLCQLLRQHTARLKGPSP